MDPFPGVDTVTLLTNATQAVAMNHRIIANNIANVDTPGFNPVRLDFQDTLRATLEGRERIALRRTHPRHLEGTRNLFEFKHLAQSSKNDYNKVDLDEEVSRLSENTTRYTLYSGLLVKQFRRMRDLLSNIR